MYDCPSDLKYTRSHEWIYLDDPDDGVVIIGLTDFAQDKLGEMVRIDLPDVGDHFDVGDDISIVESVKAASEIYSPLAGEVVEVNTELEESTGLVNSANYSDGWLFKLKLDNVEDYNDLLKSNEYEDYIYAAPSSEIEEE